MSTVRKRRLLVAYSCNSTFVGTTRQYLESFRRFSGWDVHYIHVTDSARIDFDFSAYDALFHSYCARLCFDGYVSPSYIEAARRFEGVKIIAVQDEYDFTGKVQLAVADIGFDIFLTCAPEESWEYVYPKALFPRTTFMRVLTGYVPDNLLQRKVNWTPLAARPFMIGYRGRDIGARYGRLGFEKMEIGRRMLRICQERGLATDIALNEESRIYGDGWFDFLGSCRATLGTESGSNIFDFDGQLAADFGRLEEKLGRPPSYDEFEPRIRGLEARIEMGQVSPRVFEAAITRTPMILFEGRYSGVVQPDVHYIPLRKDFSNIDEVLARLDDCPGLEAMAERAFADLIASERYSYRTFVNQVLGAAGPLLEQKPAAADLPLPALREEDLLEVRINTADPLQETPTLAPLSYAWYQVAMALRVNHSLADDIGKLLCWARKETEEPDRMAAIDAVEGECRDIGAAHAAALRAADPNAAGAINKATQEVRRAYDALSLTIVRIVLQGRSRGSVVMATFRAPWVEQDIPELRRAKRLRERLHGVSAVRKLLSVIRARRQA
jgi:hypothetical protein